jgi:uncharacterized protein
MTLTISALRIARAASILALMGVSSLAVAADPTPEHLAAARAAIAAIKATDQFDVILPQAADSLKGEMIQKDPNLEAAITSAVDEEVIKLAARRADLEKEAARAYANIFSVEELNGIATFYSSDVGKKLIAEGPLATREVIKAANIWQTGVSRDLAEAVAKKVKAAAEAAAPVEAPAEEPKPAEGEKPKK